MTDIYHVKVQLMSAAKHLLTKAETLSALDALSGDGDLGLTVEKVCKAITSRVEQNKDEDIGKLFMEIALAVSKEAPSTMGTLIAFGFMNLAKREKGKKQISDRDIAQIPKWMAETIAEKGKAKLGDKTILDALIPMGEIAATEFEKTSDLKKSFAIAAKEAIQSAENTKGLVANAGRAKWIGKRAAENPDPGAMLCAFVAELYV